MRNLFAFSLCSFSVAASALLPRPLISPTPCYSQLARQQAQLNQQRSFICGNLTNVISNHHLSRILLKSYDYLAVVNVPQKVTKSDQATDKNRHSSVIECHGRKNLHR